MIEFCSGGRTAVPGISGGARTNHIHDDIHAVSVRKQDSKTAISIDAVCFYSKHLRFPKYELGVGNLICA